jgi:hypothetical protein
MQGHEADEGALMVDAGEAELRRRGWPGDTWSGGSLMEGMMAELTRPASHTRSPSLHLSSEPRAKRSRLGDSRLEARVSW